MSDSGFPPPPPPGDGGGAPPPPPPPPGGYAAPVGGTAAMSPAGFGSRLGAYIIDYLVLGVPSAIVFFIALSAVDGQTGLCEQPDGTGTVILLLIGLCIFAAFLWYYGNFEGRQGQTIGKKSVGIKVIDAGSGEPIGFGRAIGRRFATIISGIPCYLGYLWMLWDSDKQTWHDKIVTARVVRA